MIWLGAAHKIVQIITRAVYGKIRSAFSFRITRESVFYALPSLCRMLVSAGAVAPQYPFPAIVYNDAKAAIIVGLKKSAAELGKLVELLFFSNMCHNFSAAKRLPPDLNCYYFCFMLAKLLYVFDITKLFN